jgi:hypothetical protein
MAIGRYDLAIRDRFLSKDDVMPKQWFATFFRFCENRDFRGKRARLGRAV